MKYFLLFLCGCGSTLSAPNVTKLQDAQSLMYMEYQQRGAVSSSGALTRTAFCDVDSVLLDIKANRQDTAGVIVCQRALKK